VSSPWLVSNLVWVEPKPPRFAPEAQLVCRVIEPPYAYCVATTVERWGYGYIVRAEIHPKGDEAEPPKNEFGWMADSAFMPLVAVV